MNNQELTPEQEEAQIRDDLKVAIDIGKALKKLRTSPDYKLVFDEVFIQKGLDILWQNTRNLTEGQLTSRGSDKNQEVLGLIQGQIKSRLDFKGFIGTVESDYESAVETLAEMDAEENSDA